MLTLTSGAIGLLTVLVLISIVLLTVVWLREPPSGAVDRTYAVLTIAAFVVVALLAEALSYVNVRYAADNLKIPFNLFIGMLFAPFSLGSVAYALAKLISICVEHKTPPPPA